MEALKVDLNSDLGEGFDNDEALLKLISSANIACGFHAGDPSMMRKTVKLAIENNVAIGAHPGLPDRENFGRKEIDVSPEEVMEMVLHQISSLHVMTIAEGGVLHHVKPHGALYNMAVKDAVIAKAIAETIFSFDPRLILYGLAGSEMINAAKDLGLPYAQEVFADRSYQQDGSLTSRKLENAVITDPSMAVNQAVRMVKEHKVKCLQDSDIDIVADSICIHGDTPGAVKFAKELRARLVGENIEIMTFNFYIQQ